MAGTTSMVSGALPYTNSFESYSYGALPAADGWSYSGSSSATVDNVVYLDTHALNTAFMGSPITNDSHDKVLSFVDATLTNSFSDTASNNLVVIDTMIQPTIAKTVEYNDAVSNSQVCIMFLTNGVAIWQGFQTNTVDNYAADTNAWVILNNNATPVSSGKWVRLTMTIDYKSLPTDGAGWELGTFTAMFQVKIDGQPLISANGHVTNNMASASPGPWFLMAPKAWPAKINYLSLSGNGMLDDLIVGTNTISELVTSNHFIPFRWLTLSGLVTNEPPSVADLQAADSNSSDADGDGMINWQEYLAGTEPTNFESKLVILNQVISNGFATIQWLSTTNVTAPYSILMASNLNSNDWTTISNNLSATLGGTNTVSGPVVTNPPAFFRVQVTK